MRDYMQVLCSCGTTTQDLWPGRVFQCCHSEGVHCDCDVSVAIFVIRVLSLQVWSLFVTVCCHISCGCHKKKVTVVIFL